MISILKPSRNEDRVRGTLFSPTVPRNLVILSQKCSRCQACFPLCVVLAKLPISRSVFFSLFPFLMYFIP